MYDKNGNITALNRKGHTNVGATNFGTMDNLVYTYNTTSNKLKKVLDNGNDNYGFVDTVNQATEFTYDTNGNMISDANKEDGALKKMPGRHFKRTGQPAALAKSPKTT